MVRQYPLLVLTANGSSSSGRSHVVSCVAVFLQVSVMSSVASCQTTAAHREYNLH